MRKLVVVSLFLQLLFSCGGETPQPPASEPVTPATAMEIAREQTAKVQDRHERATLGKETVKAMLPGEVAGLSRVSLNANAMKMGGFDMTTAEAEYRNETQRIKVTVADGMGLQTMGVYGQAAAFEIDSEEGGQRRYTTKIDGHKAMVDYNKRSRQGTLTVIFPQSTVTIDANQIDGEADLEKIFGQLDLDDL